MYLTGEDEKYLKGFRKQKDLLLKPLNGFLAKFKIKPIYLSWAGFFMELAFIYLIIKNNPLAWLALVLAIILDGMDGSLARFRKMENEKGFWADFAFDNLGFLLILFFLIIFGKVFVFWGWAYLLNYFLVLILAVYALLKKKKLLFVFRSKYYFLIFYFMDFYLGSTIVTPFLVFMSVYMLILNIANLFVLHKKWKII